MNTTGESEPSAQIVLQRVRNRIIEHLELIGSFDAQRQYQFKVQFSVVPEIINGWDDWVIDGWESSYLAPVFSDEDRSEIARFGTTLSDVADHLPESLPSLSEVQSSNEWLRLREAAERALRVFGRRGRLPENEEGTGGAV